MTIKEGVTNVPELSLSEKERLPIRKVILPESVKTIEEDVFYEWNNLEEINFPNSLSVIGKNAFMYCKKLDNVLLPENIAIGSNAFYDCYNLEHIKLPTSIGEMGSFVFESCKFKEFVIPEGVTEIWGTFAYFRNLTSVKLPSSSFVS